MRLAEAIETTCIHRVAGLTGDRTGLVMTRPFRAPHHTISDAGLIGGGQVPMRGEVSLAHNGVLFLDERPECRRHVLEVLRQPPEKGITAIQFPVQIRFHRLSRIGRAREARSVESERSPLPSRSGHRHPALAYANDHVGLLTKEGNTGYSTALRP
jgi:Magnesium chelatase, subunit ChlI